MTPNTHSFCTLFLPADDPTPCARRPGEEARPGHDNNSWAASTFSGTVEPLGGWGVVDQTLHFALGPAAWLRFFSGGGHGRGAVCKLTVSVSAAAVEMWALKAGEKLLPW